MLNNNFASVSAQIARANAPYISPKKQDNLVEAIRQGANDYYTYDAIRRNNAEQDRMNVLSQNLAKALESGDEKAINDAYYAYNPQGAVETLMKIKQAKEQSDLDFARQKELLGLQNKYALALQDAKNQNQGIDMTSAAKNYEYLRNQGLSDNQAMVVAFGGNTDAVGNYLVNGGLGKMGLSTYDREMGNTLAEEEKGRRQQQKLAPMAMQAISRAEDSLKDATGLGQIGGIGWTIAQGGINRANISNAQAQMNTLMRGILSQMGVGASEMNSAAEATAYRYQISPDMPIEQQEQILQNFKNDYLSGNLHNILATNAGINAPEKANTQAFKIERIE